MLAMRDEEVFALVVVLSFLTLIVWMSLRHAHRSERMKTIQKAIESGNIDEATRRTILDALANDTLQAASAIRQLFKGWAAALGRLAFIAGWSMLVIGGIVLATMLMSGASRYDLQGPMYAVAVGFALVTLPIAMRELDSRRNAVRQ